MENKIYTVGEAMEILRGSLERCGLESGHLYITVSGHRLKRLKTVAVMQEIINGGFGENVIGENGTHRSSCRSGYYSWAEISKGMDKINLYYDLPSMRGGGR